MEQWEVKLEREEASFRMAAERLLKAPRIGHICENLMMSVPTSLPIIEMYDHNWGQKYWFLDVGMNRAVRVFYCPFCGKELD